MHQSVSIYTAMLQQSRHLQLVLVLILMVLAAGSASSLDWPYSELLANASTQVERCSTVSGFRFRNSTLPTTQQLARMCADPDCGNVTSALTYTAVQSDSHVAAFAAFVVPVLNYCWYFRTPSEAIAKLIESHTSCPSDCMTLADRLSVLLDSMLCPQAPVIADHGTITIFSAWCRGRAPLPPYGKDIEAQMIGAAAVYSYQADWPIPAADASTSNSSISMQNPQPPTEAKSGGSNANDTKTIGDDPASRSTSLFPSEVPSSTEGSSNTITPIAKAAVCCLALLFVVGLVYKRRRRASDPFKDNVYATAGSPRVGDEVANNPLDVDGLLSIERVVPVKHIQDVRMIGSGGHGIVYLVKDTVHDRLLASKRLLPSQVTDKTISAFFDEIKTVSTLQHPCIVTFVGATWANRTDVQALFEYMDGGDLRTYLDTTPATGRWTSEKLTIAMDIANALVYVHSELPTPLVHRDLKSRNVLLSKSPLRAKLSDFGVAREVSQNESMTNGVGTSRWLAPVVILGRGDYGTACDIYSFGVVLSELDTHKIPFWDCGSAGSDTMVPEVTILSMVALKVRQPTFSLSCPPKILALARQCMARNPDERPMRFTWQEH